MERREDGGGGEEDEGQRSAGRGARKIYSRPAIGLWAAGRLAPKASLACSCRCRSQLVDPIKPAPPTASKWSKSRDGKARRHARWRLPVLLYACTKLPRVPGEATLMEPARARQRRSSAVPPRHRAALLCPRQQPTPSAAAPAMLRAAARRGPHAVLQLSLRAALRRCPCQPEFFGA